MPHQAKSSAGESFSELKTFEKMNTAASLNIPKIFQKSEDEEKNAENSQQLWKKAHVEWWKCLEGKFP